MVKIGNNFNDTRYFFVNRYMFCMAIASFVLSNIDDYARHYDVQHD